MKTQILRSLCAQNYKTLNQQNPGFMSNIFKLSSSNRVTRKDSVLNLQIERPNQANFDEESLRALESDIWNNLPSHIKFAKSLSTFKNLIKFWNSVSCQCDLCKIFHK